MTPERENILVVATALVAIMVIAGAFAAGERR